MWMVWETRQWTCIIPLFMLFSGLGNEGCTKKCKTRTRAHTIRMMIISSCVCVCCCIIVWYSTENVKEQVIKWSGRETNGKKAKGVWPQSRLCYSYMKVPTICITLCYIYGQISSRVRGMQVMQVLSIAKNHTNHKFRLDVIKLVQTLCD